ncbi:hypothetical protein ABB37_05948 [Leptomonas pyrrhocoris]|uniref:Uncharacterized protein n=1 Tax=Leptomonas pyrrhocoris TaxID=157538 RepID=A0A0N0DUG0_LEPPY|nr:hypothetical protein ABB37_05948 [Leptomonas pyrrhocoris]KPA78884.1 hypothetical protein ABB37_05948 [Leptomonas pyrrhocoris]|eukprot:XP_015657323.1 hypothetical protein ABB37_05948 [Leptomonas pyrrhocoris]
MGVAPSRETIRRGFFNVNQANPSSAGGGGSSKRQDIVLIPLTKEYFPSSDCPLFVQFHKARCDAAVNYYFRRPGNPGDLSCIPNYESSYRLPGEETRAQRRRRRQLAREARAAEGAPSMRDRAGRGDGEYDDLDEDTDDDADEDESFPSREALYHGVIEHVEEVLFDTDAEMRQAYQWALAHPHTTMGPDGKKQRKVLPVLCAVAFRSDIGKAHHLHNAAAAAGSARPSSANGSAATVPLPTSPSSHMSSSTIAMSNMQAALENGVYMFGSIINIVGCFGFVSMQEDVDDAKRMSHQQADSASAMSPPLLTPGSLQPPSPSGGGGTYHHDPYSFTSSQASSGSLVGGGGGSNGKPTFTAASGGTLLSSRGAGRKGARHLAQIAAATDLMTLPPPVAAPLAAMVFLTKSAGEQNLGRVTYIAASTYYYQMIQAGLIERQTGVRMEGPNVYPSSTTSAAPSPLPPYGGGSKTTQGGGVGGGATAVPPLPPMYSPSSPTSPHAAGSPVFSPPTPNTQGPPKPFLPPMETFSFSSLLTNIPVLSFLYEMKWRWGYLGVLKAGTPTAGTSRNSSFSEAASGPVMSNNVNSTTGRGPGSMMGNHSTGGLAAIDRSVGQGVTDELEMWITMDQMIHGRVSKDLAQRLCWSLAERPEVMQERVLQLPSEESGYWRYRGLVDQTHLPPIPAPGTVVMIHPKDVYVMGSDVLPGFNEGDILRFDPERLVWFADHSIPLEGLVLAAMRPYCKQAREAGPEDPSWVTKVCDAEEAEALQGWETDVAYPTPPASAAEAALLASDTRLVHTHEHVGNFYVYRFVRDGTTYFHGTVPNFANRNKKRLLPSAANAPSQGTPTHTAVAAAPNPLNNSSSSGHNAATTGARGADNINTNNNASASTAAKTTFANSSNTTNTTGTATTNNSSSKPTVPVPKTIASALFSLLPASRAMAGGSSGANTASVNGGVHANPGGATNITNNTSNGNAGNTPNATAPSPATTTTTTAYLATPVTSTAINTARKWVQALYSYAYGAPNTTASAAAGGKRRGPTAASLAAGGVGGPSSSAGAAAGVSPGLPTSTGGGPSPLATRAPTIVTPLRSVAGDGAHGSGGSFPSTPVYAPHVNAKTPTSGAPGTAVGFPNVTAYDVSVWPTPKFIGAVSQLGMSPHVNSGSSPAGTVMSPGTPQLATQHSRSSSHSLMRQVNGQEGDEAAPPTASKPVKRYVAGGSYEWDWRNQ